MSYNCAENNAFGVGADASWCNHGASGNYPKGGGLRLYDVFAPRRGALDASNPWGTNQDARRD
ncbi:MAG: hypothetical protein ACJ8KO_03795, partial [Sulfurifustaceae bacterium]